MDRILSMEESMPHKGVGVLEYLLGLQPCEESRHGVSDA